ncbi:MAG: hypothetical protein ACREDN_05845, partial [Aestuariivirga sp.]
MHQPLVATKGTASAAWPASNGDASPIHQRLLDAKLRIHRRLIDEINLSAADKMSVKELRPEIYELVA